ncbi:MAG: type II secretion system F family protein [Actinobacteria bacterium]|nr:type II secretion system F family protein [Actinomycetota bacterium]MBI3686369.1 type II secretion system F family protein [Actinomycetota bacterium]
MLTAVASALAAAALLAVRPLQPAGAVRVGRVLRGPAGGRSGPSRVLARTRALVVKREVAVLFAVGVGLVGTGLAGPVVGSAAGLGSGVAAQLLRRGRLRRAAEQEEGAAVEAVSALVAEVRAGQPPDQALRAVGEGSRGAVAGVLTEAAAASRIGGSPARALSESAGCSTRAASVLGRVAVCWQVSESAGAPLTPLLEGAERSARAGRARRRQLAVSLAGCRATAGLLGVLPLAGIALGAAIGARPLSILTGTAPGQVALLVGVCLDCAGLAWTGWIVRTAEEAS